MSILGIDLGTQSIKAVLYDPDGECELASTSAPYDLIEKSDGTREQMTQWWAAGLKQCLDKISPGLKSTIKAIGVSGQQHGFVAIDQHGDSLVPVKLWCDTATEAECNEIMQAVGGPGACTALTGNPIAVGYTASKIRWLKKNNPKAYDAMATILLPHDWLNFHLTGERVMEFGDASGTGLLDVKQRIWCPELITALDKDRDLSSCLPRLIEAHQSAGRVGAWAANEYGLPAGATVSSGGGDNMMAAIGTGNVVPGRLTASLGTSGTLFGYSDEPVIDSEAQLAAFCSSSGGWLPLLCTMNCTYATEKLRDLLAQDIDELNRLATAIPIGCEGVITLPFFNGERTPALPNAKASIFGLSGDNFTQGHLMRSAMESAIFGLRTGLEAFRRCGMRFDSVILTGGGSNSLLWRQICADVFNLPVRVIAQPENAAMGAALQALWCLGHETGNPKTLQEITDRHLREDRSLSVAPNKESVEKYRQIYGDYMRLVKHAAEIYS